MTHRRGPVLARSAAAVVVGCACAASGAVAAPDAAPAVSAFRLTPVTLRPPAPGAFGFVTTREGAATIAIARISRSGRLRPLGHLRFAADAGAVRRSFDGRVAGRRLPPGRYRATVTVANERSGPSPPRRLTFRVTG